MPALKTYNLFISHSWAYGNAYEELIKLLSKANNFSYRNYSVPKDDPIHNAANDRELHAAIKNQISYCHVVLILAGVYASYSKWINKEIIICQNEFYSTKPIIAIEPWASEKTSITVKNAADQIVGWNTNSIVNAIRSYSI